jgi:hypothetical protein
MSTPAQAPYEIARHLSDEARRAAVARTYAPSTTPTGHVSPRCDHGYCPLGVALMTMGKPTMLRYYQPAPAAEEVAAALAGALGDVQRAAEAFIDDWDHGAIIDLAAALGVS